MKCLLSFSPLRSRKRYRQKRTQRRTVCLSPREANLSLIEECLEIYAEQRMRYLEERTRRLEARKRWNLQNIQFDMSTSGAFSTDRASSGLSAFELSGQDDQYLFELGLKLRFDRETEVAVKSLLELTECALVDFPALVFVQKKTLIVQRQRVP